MRLLIVVLFAGVLAAPALAGPRDPKLAHSLAGMLSAQKALLKQSDHPKGWKGTPLKVDGKSNACNSTPSSFSDLTETGSAISPYFALGQLQSVIQRVRTFRNAKQAGAWYSRTVTISLVSCLAEQLKSASSAKATVSIVGQLRLSPPKVVQQIDGFRVVAHTNVPSEKEQFNVYADVIVMRQGAEVTTVWLTGFIKPIDSGLEDRLTRTIAGRIGGKSTVA